MKHNFFITVNKNLLFPAILIAALSRSADAQTYTLNQILDSIEINNPGLQQFSLKTAATIAEGNAAKAWMAPTAGIGLSEFPYGAGKNMGAGMMPRKMLMSRLQQMFPNFNQQNKEKAYAESFARQNGDDRATMKNRLFSHAKVAYYDAYVAEKKLALVAQQEKQIRLLLQISKGRLQYDKANLPDIYKAKAKLSDLQAMRIQLQSVTAQSAVILNSLMNRSQEKPLTIDTAINVAQYDLNISTVDSAYIMLNRSDIVHISDEINSLLLNKEAIKSQAKPSFDIDWDNMRMNSGGYMYNIMATVSIPIAPWFSKRYQSKAKSIDYQIQAMDKMRESQVQEAIGSIRKDWLKLQAAQKDIRIFRDEVIPAYAKTYLSYLNAFSENTGNIYETLMAWDDVTMKEMEYWDKISNLLNIRVMLETEIQGTTKQDKR